MPVTSGTNLGPYEILSPIGRGGMGEVYRARDTRLDRIVAIKILPASVSDDPERRKRFEREARVIAGLNHPNICSLFDIGHHENALFLVMEYLEGVTLSDRLKRGPLPVAQALACGTEIADALDNAHRHGVTHRDVKPGNIMLTRSGAKLLDFGLAKTLPAAQRADGSGPWEAATESRPLTSGVEVLGTLQYMAPEQLEGKAVDARTDIFALGAVLYEMLTGRKSFQGGSQANLIAAILDSEPPPVSALQPAAPRSLDRLVKTCLVKDPDERWQSAHDLLCELTWIAEGGSEARLASPSPFHRWGGWILAAVSFLLALALAAIQFRATSAGTGLPSLRLSVAPPAGATVHTVSVSPDGRRLALVASLSGGQNLLWVTPLESNLPKPLAGTEGAAHPFWSPDSRFISFFAEGKLKKVDVSGAPTETLCAAASPRGGSWGPDGTIIFAVGGNSGVFRVPASGGEPRLVTNLDLSRREDSHRWPSFLPDGRHFLYFARSGEPNNTGVYAGSIDSKETRLVLSSDSLAAVARPGYLLYVREGTLMAQSFDEESLGVSGEPVALAEGVWSDPSISGLANFSLSANGVLAYRGGGAEKTELVWFDRRGNRLGVVGPPATYLNLALSPDQKKLAVSRAEPGSSTTRNLWIFDLASGTSSRLTFDPVSDFQPLWSPDGSRIAFTSNRAGPFDIYQTVPGGGKAEMIFKSDNLKYIQDWSRDGRFIVYNELDSKRADMDLWTLPLSGDRKPEPFRQTGSDEWYGQFSPDGRWIAYASNVSGRFDTFVQPFPATGAKWQISTDGGVQPKWRRDGKELFYVAPDAKMMAVEVRAGGTFEPGVPRALFGTRIGVGVRPDSLNHYEVSADGERFLISSKPDEPTPIVVIVNWLATLQR